MIEKKYKITVYVMDLFDHPLLQKYLGTFDTVEEAETCVKGVTSAENIFGAEELDKIVNTAEYAIVTVAVCEPRNVDGGEYFLLEKSSYSYPCPIYNS